MKPINQMVNEETYQIITIASIILASAIFGYGLGTIIKLIIW